MLINVLIGIGVTSLVVISDNNDDNANQNNDDDDDGFPANSPHDKIPPWWEYVINR